MCLCTNSQQHSNSEEIISKMSKELTSYKEEHEAFVSNVRGVGLLSLLTCLGHAPTLILLLKLTQKNSKPQLLRDLTYLVFPLLLSVTLLADYSCWTIFGIWIAELVFLQKLKPHTGTTQEIGSQPMAQGNRRSFITLFKGCNTLITIISILAVDFPIFPRRFAKTQTFGLSLMDVGAGTFIVSSALTSRYARGIVSAPAPSWRSSASSSSSTTKPSPRTEWQLWQRMAVLLLGVGRMFVIKLCAYQEPVTEYGEHWNFFVTLFCVWTGTDFLHHLFPRGTLFWLSLAALLAHQFMLSSSSLTDYMLNGERRGFLSSNREGIFSLLGLIPLFLITEFLSFHFFFARGSSTVEEDDEEEKFHQGGSKGVQNSMGALVGLGGGLGGTAMAPSTSVEGMIGIGMGMTSDTAQLQLHLQAGGTSGLAEENGVGAPVGADDVKVVSPGGIGGPAPISSSSSSSSSNSSGGSGGGGGGTNINKAPTHGGSLPFLGLPWKVLVPPSTARLAKQLTWLVLTLWGIWAVATNVQATSRRLTNLAYVSFVLALSMTLLLLIALADGVGGVGVRVLTLEHLNNWPLLIFLVANVMTGVINMSMRTMLAAPAVAFAVMALYVGALTSLAWWLGSKARHV